MQDNNLNQREEKGFFSSLLKSFLKVILPPILIVGAILTIRINWFDYLNVSGSSMYPTLQDHQLVLVDKTNKNYKRGQVISFHSSPNNPSSNGAEKLYIKRIIGLPGDSVSYKEGKLYVNGKEVNQKFLSLRGNDEKMESTEGTQKPSTSPNWDLQSLSEGNPGFNSWSQNQATVPEGTLFVMGDHRSVSLDSRYFGFVKMETVLGVNSSFPWDDKEQKYYTSDDFTNDFFVKEK